MAVRKPPANFGEVRSLSCFVERRKMENSSKHAGIFLLGLVVNQFNLYSLHLLTLIQSVMFVAHDQGYSNQANEPGSWKNNDET